MDFNPSFFSHPKAADGFTLASRDAGIRKFWINHGKVCRKIGAQFGKELGTPCVTNVWIPDGYKDTPADRKAPRELLENRSMRSSPSRSIRSSISTPSKANFRHRLGELCRRLARVLPGLRDPQQKASLPRRRPLSPDREHRRQDFVGAAVISTRSCCT